MSDRDREAGVQHRVRRTGAALGDMRERNGEEQRRGKMTGRELRRLKRRELLKMLLVQCEETERLQEECDKIKKKFDDMSESYERLKKKLDVKDERLTDKDARIAALKEELEKLKESREAELESVESIASAAVRLDEMFSEAETAAEQYLEKVRKLKEGVKTKLPEQEQALPAAGNETDWIPFGGRKLAGLKEKANTPRNGELGEVVAVDFAQRQADKSAGEEQNPEEAQSSDQVEIQPGEGADVESVTMEEAEIEEGSGKTWLQAATAGGLNG